MMKFISYLAVILIFIENYNFVKAQNPEPVIEITPKNLRIIKEGASLRLTCRATVNKIQVPVRWTKKDNKKLSSRFEEEFNGGIVLKGATLEDAGEYECHVGEFSSSTQLVIHQKPKVILDPNIEQLNVTEGENVQFKCSAEGDPKPNIELTDLNGVINTSNKEIDINLSNIQVNQSGIYTCKAKNAAGQDVKKIEINVGRKKIPIESESIEETTEKVIITTSSSIEIISTTLSPVQTSTTTTLSKQIPTTTTSSSQSLITKKSSTETSTTERITTTSQMQPKTIPDQIFSYAPPRKVEYKTNEGETAELNCQIKGSTARTNWRRSDKQVMPQGAQTDAGKLTIENIGRDANGDYDCFTTDNYGQTVTVLVANIQVNPSPPKITLQSPKSVTLGEDVTILCHATGEGQIRTQWSCEGRQGFPEGVVAIGHILKFNKINYSHQGKYICTASSNYGMSSKTTMISFSSTQTETVPYKPTRQCSVGDTVTMSCKIFDGLSVRQYQWIKQNGQLPQYANQRLGVLTIFNVQSRDGGRYVCRVHTHDGGMHESFTDLHVNAKQCEADEFSCDNSKCLPSSAKCDGILNCIDQSDEMNCNSFVQQRSSFFTSQYNNNCEFRCPDMTCYTARERCNGRYECADGSDETNCRQISQISFFRCARTGEIISMSKRCDGRFDCRDFSDEYFCY
ncbi:hypothetical protein PVAND_010008 [Polypedilum vanderplanki]|uniref:Ig-like domain-containing protein n=1 Tax=Polypedilum vanderplanki TaxID=319348 RepID=A0A9J6CEY7_POLVA|nr:hypothetical protein PVAND_010008 [Polypedilum vanderplanki]